MSGEYKVDVAEKALVKVVSETNNLVKAFLALESIQRSLLSWGIDIRVEPYVEMIESRNGLRHASPAVYEAVLEKVVPAIRNVIDTQTEQVNGDETVTPYVVILGRARNEV